jgi:predicted ATPase
MSKIKIKNFGPIKEGYCENDGWLDVKKVTVFIGDQGSGKSTVAKLISTLSWIEKAMVKGQIREDELNTYNRFQKRLSYQKIDNYIKSETEIEFKGNAYTFQFSKGAFSVSKAPENGYLLPKIMYVPAERNFLSVVDRPDKLKELPLPLFTFLDEYDRARNVFWDGLSLPITKAHFKYDRQNKIAHIIDEGYDIRLSEASSGFQSTVPLFLVTKYLTEGLTQEDDQTIKESSIEEQRKLEKEVKRILEDNQLSPDIKQESLRQLSAKRKPSCFINIVEEPEQNLFPSSQRNILNELLKNVNHSYGNRLLITTHSPYLINYLTLAIKAYFVSSEIELTNNRDRLTIKLDEIVPLKSKINSDDVVIYEWNEWNGTIIKLGDYKGLPSDENYLNQKMGESNTLFANLLEIEDKCR